MTETHPERSHRALLLELLLVATVFYALAFAGFLSNKDAFIFLCLVALSRPPLRPCLLILAAGVQDAPGMSYFWSYLCFVSIATLMLIQHAIAFITNGATCVPGRFEKAMNWLLIVAFIAVIYGVLASVLHSNLGGFSQSAKRPYLAIGGLIILMMVSGHISARQTFRQPGGRQAVGVIALVAAFHTLIIGLLQIPFGQELYRSGDNLEKVMMAGQLTDASVFGFARINGPFLSPNAFGYFVLLACLVLLITNGKNWPRLAARVFLFFGAAAVILSLSKALAAYYLAFGVIVYWMTISRARVLAFAALATGAAIYLMPTYLFEMLVMAFRFDGGGLGSRAQAWSSVTANLSFSDWIFGVGLSAWPDFFQLHIGIDLSDPHTMLLSVPGTFGLVGVVVYGFLFFLLIERYLNPSSGHGMRVGILGVVLLLIGKDLVSIPTLLGNTPFTFMVWLCISFLMIDRTKRQIKEKIPDRELLDSSPHSPQPVLAGQDHSATV